jgi:hypothetical protein
MRIHLVAVVCAALSAGCLSSTSIIHVRADGTGTVTNTILLKDSTLQLLNSLQASNSASAEGKKDAAQGPKEFFSEEKMREMAPRLGDGVTFQSMQPLKESGWEGAKVTYAFSDISKVRFNMRSQATPEMGSDSKPELLTFRFARAAAGPANLTIVMPEEALKKAMSGEAAKKPPSDQEALGKAMLEQFKSMFEGMKASVAVEVAGPIVKTNADHVTGSTVTLLAIDFNELMKTSGNLETFAGLADGSVSIADARAKLKDVKGLVLTLQPEVMVAFGK